MKLTIIKQFDIDVELVDMIPLAIKLQFNRVVPQTVELDLINIQQLLMLFKYGSTEFSSNYYVLV